MTVLVADDHDVNRKLLRSILQGEGYEVLEAANGIDALNLLESASSPMVGLVDWEMPQMEGIEAVERIVQEHPDARVVMVSSVGYQENILAALQKGARHFVQKPVKPEVLYEILRYVLNEEPATAPVGASEGRTP